MLVLLAIIPSLRVLIIGIPPATAASNSKLTFFLSASKASSSPYFEIKALFAVMTCFLFFYELNTNFFAGPSEPPINSTTTSTSINRGASK